MYALHHFFDPLGDTGRQALARFQVGRVINISRARHQHPDQLAVQLVDLNSQILHP